MATIPFELTVHLPPDGLNFLSDVDSCLLVTTPAAHPMQFRAYLCDVHDASQIFQHVNWPSVLVLSPPV